MNVRSNIRLESRFLPDKTSRRSALSQDLAKNLPDVCFVIGKDVKANIAYNPLPTGIMLMV
jgi:hypothetical protein